MAGLLQSDFDEDSEANEESEMPDHARAVRLRAQRPNGISRRSTADRTSRAPQQDVQHNGTNYSPAAGEFMMARNQQSQQRSKNDRDKQSSSKTGSNPRRGSNDESQKEDVQTPDRGDNRRDISSPARKSGSRNDSRKR
jgi:hypothetical protein